MALENRLATPLSVSLSLATPDSDVSHIRVRAASKPAGRPTGSLSASDPPRRGSGGEQPRRRPGPYAAGRNGRPGPAGNAGCGGPLPAGPGLALRLLARRTGLGQQCCRG